MRASARWQEKSWQYGQWHVGGETCLREEIDVSTAFQSSFYS